MLLFRGRHSDENIVRVVGSMPYSFESLDVKLLMRSFAYIILICNAFVNLVSKNAPMRHTVLLFIILLYCYVPVCSW
jgi:hypothetical protein